MYATREAKGPSAKSWGHKGGSFPAMEAKRGTWHVGPMAGGGGGGGGSPTGGVGPRRPPGPLSHRRGLVFLDGVTASQHSWPGYLTGL
jgi:hypothetical protein